jgi:hypothetical protein
MNDLILLLQQVKARWGVETVNAIKARIEAENAIFSSDLLNSITATPDETLDGNISFKMTDYGKFIDEGVNGLQQSQGSEYSFRGNWKGTAAAIEPWATAKGLNPWAVARSIQDKGITPRRFFKSVIEARLDDLALDLEQAYQTYLDEQINNR